MEFAVYLAEARGVDVRIDLGRADVGVAKEFLNGSNVRTVG